jgi:hypothetical protein
MHRKPITSITAVLLPFATYLLTLPHNNKQYNWISLPQPFSVKYLTLQQQLVQDYMIIVHFRLSLESWVITETDSLLRQATDSKYDHWLLRIQTLADTLGSFLPNMPTLWDLRFLWEWLSKLLSSGIDCSSEKSVNTRLHNKRQQPSSPAWILNWPNLDQIDIFLCDKHITLTDHLPNSTAPGYYKALSIYTERCYIRKFTTARSWKLLAIWRNPCLL